MSLLEFLIDNKKQILNEAFENLSSAHLSSYDTSTSEDNLYRLENLFDLMVESIKSRNLSHINDYSKEIAKERFEAGFDLHEVHTAFNALEEVIWKIILKKFGTEKLGEALGLISTVLGSGKETLAVTYVSLATKRKSASLDLKNLFMN